VFFYQGDKPRHIDGRKAKLVAAKEFETDLNLDGVMPDVRTTMIDCSAYAKFGKASCRAVYGTKGTSECQSKNYLLVKNNDVWVVHSRIEDGEKIDFRTGELIKRKPHPAHC